MSSLKMKTFLDLLIRELKELHSIQIQIVHTFPQIIKASDNDDLIELFSSFVKEKNVHLKRIKKSFNVLGMDVCKENSCTIEGLIKEYDIVIDTRKKGMIRDAEFIGITNRIIHYEMARYGSAIHFADILEEEDVRDILAQSLEEERLMDSFFSKFVVSPQNKKILFT